MGIAIMPVGLAAAQEGKTPASVPATAETNVPKLECPRPQLPQQLPTAAADTNNLVKQA